MILANQVLQFIIINMDSYKNITLEQVTEHLNSIIKEKEEDINIKPDIKIIDRDNLFWVSISGMNLKLNTGIGGFKMFLDDISDLDFMKVEYNDIILNKEQKQELLNKIKYGNIG